MRRRIHQTKIYLIALMALLIGACTEMPHPRGKPVAEQTFEHFEAIPLRAANIDIQQIYVSGQQEEDIANTLILPPHIALINYANRRFRSGGGMDSFRFVLENAKVTKRIIQPDSQALRWTGLANDEEFRFQIEVSLSRLSPAVVQGPGVTLTLDRTMIIPERKSIAEREARQSQFVEKLVRDIDAMALEALRTHMDLL